MRPIWEIRYENLKNYAKKIGGTGPLCEKLCKTQGQVSNLISNPPRRHLGEKLARKFEEQLELEPFFLDQDFAKQKITILDKLETIYIQCIDVQQTEKEGAFMMSKEKNSIVPLDARRLAEKGINKENCLAMLIEDDFMSNTIAEGDTVVFDRAATDCIDNGSLYLVNVKGNLVVRRVFKEAEGYVKVVCDNNYMKLKFPDIVINLQDQTSKVLGKVFYILKQC